MQDVSVFIPHSLEVSELSVERDPWYHEGGGQIPSPQLVLCWFSLLQANMLPGCHDPPEK